MSVAATPALLTLGCVSYLNARPLIEGLDRTGDARLSFDVPSGLLARLERDEVDVALLPVIDYAASEHELVILPVGGIGCDGPTHTVKLFSRVPIEQLDTVRADPDSHTSVALLRVIFLERYGRAIRFTPDAPARLLIGDKVELDPPKDHPFTLDLGEAWKALTGLPFVFAVWMAKRGRPLGELPLRLAQARERGMTQLEAIIEQHALPRGYTREVARHYLGSLLRYAVGPRELEAMTRFWAMAQRAGCVQRVPPLRCGA